MIRCSVETILRLCAASMPFSSMGELARCGDNSNKLRWFMLSTVKKNTCFLDEVTLHLLDGMPNTGRRCRTAAENPRGKKGGKKGKKGGKSAAHDDDYEPAPPPPHLCCSRGAPLFLHPLPSRPASAAPAGTPSRPPSPETRETPAAATGA